jgi:hypothetical protein
LQPMVDREEALRPDGEDQHEAEEQPEEKKVLMPSTPPYVS